MPHADPLEEREYQREYKRRRRADPHFRQRERERRDREAENRAARAKHKQRLADPAYRERKRKTALKSYRRVSLVKNQRRRLAQHQMTVEQFNAMSETQGGKCRICREPPTKFGHNGRLCIDHDHATGKVRGLLCGHCNSGLGHFRDRPERLAAAIDYLREHGVSA